MGPTLVVIGLVIVAIGAAAWMGVPIARLPGDLVFRWGGVTVYLPITTSVLISLAWGLVSWLVRR